MELTNQKAKQYNPSMSIRIAYRLLDIFIGIIGCLVTLLLCVIIKILCIKSNDFDPIFFTQKRIGKSGKLFKMYKFRTMVPNADQILIDLMEADESIRKEYEINKKLSNDPRITKLGHKLRKSSLDEFPQFLNIVKGDMTLVGPRPYLPREIKDMGNTYKTIIQCKPAITGPWQVGGRNEIHFKDRCLIDVEYMQTKNMKIDLNIFRKTLSTVIRKKGAR